MSDDSTGGGPQNSGEQGVPGGGVGQPDHGTGSIHYTDHGEGSHSSWNESTEGVTKSHSTDHETKEKTQHPDEP
jgi:hypothetical protein